MALTPNALFQADCLALLERLEAERVTLAYLDPPWFSEALSDLGPAHNPEPEDAALGRYLNFIGDVLQQIHRVLSPRGSVFFHTEPGLSPYVRILHDRVFGRRNFRQEYVLQRPVKHLKRQSWSRGHETILYYARSSDSVYHPPTRPLAEEDLAGPYETDERGRYRLADVTAPGNRPGFQFPFRQAKPPKGRSWRHTEAELAKLEADGEIVTRGGRLRRKRYVSDDEEIEVGTVWDDMRPYDRRPHDSSMVSQRPVELLRRVLHIGSDAGDTVLDPFCGSGTSIVAAESEGRRWIACDVAEFAVSTATKRLADQFNLQPIRDYQFGEQDLLAALQLPIHQAYEDVSQQIVRHNLVFILGKRLPIEESRHFEFKEVRGNNPSRAIQDVTEQYAVAFLNSEGGRIYWGVDDDRTVVGVQLTHRDRDDIRRVVTERLNGITPSVAPTKFQIEFHQVQGDGADRDLFVVEVVVPRGDSSTLYWTNKTEAYVRTDAGKKKLSGPEIQEEVLRRRQHRA